MDFVEHDEQFFPLSRIRIARELASDDARTELQRADVERGQHSKEADVRRREKAHIVEPTETLEGVRCTHGDEPQEQLMLGEWACVEKDHSHGHQRGDELPRR